MEPAPNRFPEPSFGKQGNQGDHDNPADGKHDGGPGQGEGVAKIAVYEQFNPYAENGGFRKQIERCGNNGNGQFTDAQSKNLRQDGHKGYDGYGKLPEPSAGSGQKGNHI